MDLPKTQIPLFCSMPLSTQNTANQRRPHFIRPPPSTFAEEFKSLKATKTNA